MGELHASLALESLPNEFFLDRHLILVLVQPSIPFLWVVKIFGSAWIWFPKIRADIVAPCQSCVVSALQGNRGRFWVIRHFDIKDERNLASHFGGLTQESECASLESAALQTETLARIHLPEKSNLPILLRKHPNSEQIATRHERLIEIVARSPCALCSRILRHGSIHCACISKLIDAQIHASSLLMVSVGLYLVRLSCAKHTCFDRLFDEGRLPTCNCDPTPMQGVSLWYIARLRSAGRPWQWATRKCLGLVAIVKSLALGSLRWCQLWVWIAEIVVAQGAVCFCFLLQFLQQRRDFRAIWIFAQGSSIASIGIFPSKLMALEQVVEARLVRLATCLHRFMKPLLMECWLMKPIFEVVSKFLNLLSIQRASFVISTDLKSFFANICKCHVNFTLLFLHGLLVCVQPSVPLLWVVKVLRSARVWISQVVWGIVNAGQSRVATALDWDGLGTRIIVHFDVKYKRDLASNFCGLAQYHVWSNWVCTSLYPEAFAGIHLPEEANLPVFLGKDPNTQQITPRHQRLVEVVT
mmetsp:Transcript_70857/g.136674  ORF Transcript_70857/g.136674 Transcript_70857/m.136674 type:complete len:527 (+) Transcript_70857:134-1714(+)